MNIVMIVHNNDPFIRTCAGCCFRDQRDQSPCRHRGAEWRFGRTGAAEPARTKPSSGATKPSSAESAEESARSEPAVKRDKIGIVGGQFVISSLRHDSTLA